MTMQHKWPLDFLYFTNMPICLELLHVQLLIHC